MFQFLIALRALTVQLKKKLLSDNQGRTLKISATMVGRRQKLKKNWLKRPKAVPKIEIWTKI